MERAQRGQLAAQQVLEIMVRHELDVAMLRTGFVLAPQPDGWVDGSGQRRHSAVYVCDTDEFVSRYPGLEIGLADVLPCVDIWVHDEHETGRLRVETAWSTTYAAVSRHRCGALAEINHWLSRQLQRGVSAGSRPTPLEAGLRSLDERLGLQHQAS